MAWIQHMLYCILTFQRWLQYSALIVIGPISFPDIELLSVRLHTSPNKLKRGDWYARRSACDFSCGGSMQI